MNRTQALCQAFGWQGGTIHQVAQETGCKVSDLLYAEYAETPAYERGWFAGRTCSVEFNLRVNFPKEQGNLDFWLGVAEGLILKAKEI